MKVQASDMIKCLLKTILYTYYKWAFHSLGLGTKINPTSWIHNKKQISIGAHSFIGKSCHISIAAPSTLNIGNYVGISPYVKIFGGDRNFSTVGKHFMTITEGGPNIPIIIEDDVMIGADAIILKGVIIGEGAIIAAGTVVIKNISPYTIWGGNPAKKIGTRFSREDLIRHLELIGSKYRIEDIEQAFPG